MKLTKVTNQAWIVVPHSISGVKNGRTMDITGQKFGKLTAIRIHHKHKTQYKWLCQCACGKELVTFAHSLKRGHAKSCGCSKEVIDLTGKRFTRWTVLRKDTSRRTAHWICECVCGNKSSVTHQNLLTEDSRSCGCLESELASKRAFKHGHSNPHSRTYKAWSAMWTRCTNPKIRQWKDYGGRGIKVCNRWKDFTVFLADMGECPEDKSMGRIDNDKGYMPSNCRWEDKFQQGRNRRNNRRIEFNGENLIITEWARRTGIHHVIIHRRIKSGFTIEAALTTPVISKPKRKKIKPSE